MTREEIALATEHLDATDALIAAKAKYRADPTPANKEARDAAVTAVREITWFWRDIRAYLSPPPKPGDGVARVTTVKGKVN